MRSFVGIALVHILLVAGCADSPSAEDPESGSLAGTEYDEQHPGENLFDDKSDAPRYQVPTDLPMLVAPEVIVSLDGLTVHVFDRETGFQAVYPAGVGVKVDGVSVTPVGHFATGPNTNDSWWYVARRNKPEYFEGYPFLRITAENDNGANTYGLHGPITNPLERGYVSQGCIRMAPDDIIDLFWLVRRHPNTPVTFQTEVERDAEGRAVDVGRTPALRAPGEPIEYGASVGPRS